MFRSERFKIKVYIDIRHNNTSSILIKQSCLLKILWLKKVIPTKSYSLAMLPLLTQNIHIMHNPDFSRAFVFMLYLFKPFNFHAIHEREPWIQHYGWNRGGWGEDKKEGDSLTSTMQINGPWRCPSIDINVSEQGLPCNG